MNKHMMWVLVVVALFVGVLIGYSFERQRAINNMEAAKLSAQKQMDDLKMKTDQMLKEQSAKMMQATPSPSGMMEKTVTPTGVMKK